MEEYNQKLLEAEEKTQSLLSALEGLKSNAEELSDAKLKLGDSSKALTDLVEASIVNVKSLQALNEYAKEANIVSLMDSISSVQNTQKKLQSEIQGQLESIKNGLNSLDDLKSQSVDSFSSMESKIDQYKDGFLDLKTEFENVAKSNKLIKTLCIINILILLGVGVFAVFKLIS